MRGLRLYIPRDRLPEPDEDEFYLADLIGLAVVSPTGETLGRVKSVHNFGAGDLLEIEPPGGAATWWAPFTKAVVPEVRLGQGVVVVDRPVEVEDGSGETG
jgi:16S rRNA processing protein RimM